MESKKLTKPELYWYMIGSAIGSGLFVLLPFAIGVAGKAASISVIIGTIFSMLSFAYFYIISSFFPLTGGDYSQVAFVSPPMISGFYGYIWLTGGLTLTAYATGCISYASAVFPALAPYVKPLSFAIITIFFALNYFGTKAGAKIQGLMTVTLLIALAMFVVFGLPKVNWGGYFTDGEFFMNGFSGFSASIGLTIFVTSGCTMTASSLASQIDKPTKTVPKSAFFAQLIVAVFCTLIVIVACGVLPIEEVANQDLAIVAGEIFPRPLWIFFIIGGAVFALCTSLFSFITAFRYPFVQLAEEGWIPKVFLKTTKNGWPYITMIVLYIITLIPLIFNVTFDRIAAATSIPCNLLYVYVIIKCFKLPKQYPKQWKASILHMPMPLYYVLCIGGVLANLYLTYCYAVELQPVDAAFMVGVTILFFIFAYFAIKSKSVSPEFLQAQKDAIAQEIDEYINEQ